MKQCVLSKTTSFHALSKKKKRTKRCRFEAALFLLLLPLDMQQGKRRFCFLLFVSSSPSPCALLQPKPVATCLMMRCQSSRAPQATPPLATSVGAVTEQETCDACMGNDGTGQGRPRSPCPYK